MRFTNLTATRGERTHHEVWGRPNKKNKHRRPNHFSQSFLKSREHPQGVLIPLDFGFSCFGSSSFWMVSKESQKKMTHFLALVAFGQFRLAGALLLGRSPLDSQKQLTLNTLRTAPNNPQPWFQAYNAINPTPKGFCNADFGTVASCDGGKRM